MGLAIGRTWMKGIKYGVEGALKGCNRVDKLEGLGFQNDGCFVLPIEENWYLIFNSSQ
jgi:hypothetical protein